MYNWIIELVLTLFIIFFIVLLSFAYYSKCNHIINEETSKLKDQELQFLEVFKNSIPHWPKGLYNILLKMVDESKNSDEAKNRDESKNNDEPNNKSALKKGCGCGK